MEGGNSRRTSNSVREDRPRAPFSCLFAPTLSAHTATVLAFSLIFFFLSSFWPDFRVTLPVRLGSYTDGNAIFVIHRPANRLGSFFFSFLFVPACSGLRLPHFLCAQSRLPSFLDHETEND